MVFSLDRLTLIAGQIGVLLDCLKQIVNQIAVSLDRYIARASEKVWGKNLKKCDFCQIVRKSVIFAEKCDFAKIVRKK